MLEIAAQYLAAGVFEQLSVGTLDVTTVANLKELWLTDTVWDDERFPSTGINPPGAATDPTRNTTTGLLEFSASQVNTVAIVGQFSHAIKIGSAIRPHIHIRYPDANTGNSVWQFQYEIAGIGQEFPSSYTSEMKTFAAPGVARRHALHSFTEIDMSAYTGVSVMINCILSRLGNNGADTYGSVMPLLEFDIHHQKDSLGSRDETAK